MHTRVYTMQDTLDECMSYRHYGRWHTEWNALPRLCLHLGMIVEPARRRSLQKSHARIPEIHACARVYVALCRHTHMNVQARIKK